MLEQQQLAKGQITASHHPLMLCSHHGLNITNQTQPQGENSDVSRNRDDMMLWLEMK